MVRGGARREIRYDCTLCGKKQKRDDLTVKRSVFMTIGKRPYVLRSRTVAWLCPACLAVDPGWLSEAYHDAPGMSDVEKP